MPAFNSLKKLMADIRGFKEAASTAVERAAKDVVVELQDRGPYWTGEFYESWEVTVDRKKGASAKSTVALISNSAPHALIAMDLEPGRWGEDKNNTAPRDWYLDYVTGGELDKSVAIATDSTLVQYWRRGL